MAGNNPPSKPKEHLTITKVDQEQHTIQLNVDGCPVTLVCTPQNSPKTYARVKTILLDTVVNSQKKSLSKIGQKI